VAPFSHAVERIAKKMKYPEFCDEFLKELEKIQPITTSFIPLHKSELVVSSLVLSQWGRN
jgi:hypothetical protein